MSKEPLAYFITFSTYGVWLHGRGTGSVDKQHNRVGTPFLPADQPQEQSHRSRMREAPYILDSPRRVIVLETIREVCQHRTWKLWAVHVRSTHIHVVVTAKVDPEKVMSDFKAYASRRLKERLGELGDSKRWTQHGSTRYLWDEGPFQKTIEYVVNGQGDPMEVYQAPNSESEPEA